MVAREETRLQFSDKVTGFREIRIFGKPAFDLNFVKSVVIKGAEFPGQPPQCPDESELRAGKVHNELEPHLPREREANLRLALHFDKRIASRQ